MAGGRCGLCRHRLGAAERRYPRATRQLVADLLLNRYIRLWIYRYRHLTAERLITTLAIAVDTARDRQRDIVLPELSVEPIVPAPPVKLATRDRPPPHRRSRGA